MPLLKVEKVKSTTTKKEIMPRIKKKSLIYIFYFKCWLILETCSCWWLSHLTPAVEEQLGMSGCL